jgi:Flp pilus assembly pilin Flp
LSIVSFAGVQEFGKQTILQMEMQILLRRFWRDDHGQDMVEYSLLLGFIVLCACAILTSTRVQMSQIWSTISSSLSSAVSTSGS